MIRLRIAVKVGTSSLTHESGAMDLKNMDELARVLSDLHGAGHEIILVSSGAIAAGTAKLGLAERPKELKYKQAAAAVGQCGIMHIYDKLFSEYGCTVAVIPIVNENDSVSSDEIETGSHKVLGDNDTLSAIVASLCKADLLILLSDIDGLYSADPREDASAKLIHSITELTPEITAMAGGSGTWRGTGGMVTKLAAARIAMASGFDMVISNGSRLGDIYDIVVGKDVGTRFFGRRDNDDRA